MTTKEKEGKLSPGDQRTASLLRWAPWLSWALLTLAPALFFVVFYLTSAEDAAVYLLLAITSLVLGSATGLIVAIALLFYRRHWVTGLQERLAADGITASEIPWFNSRLTPVERRVLKQLGNQSPLLADAYCETLATRLNATRLVAHAGRELLSVEQRLYRARRITGADTTSLLEDLQLDHARLQNLQREGRQSLASAEARLQTIEAASSRGAGRTEINYLLQRMHEGNTNEPIALEAARIEHKLREETEREVRDVNQTAST